MHKVALLFHHDATTVSAITVIDGGIRALNHQEVMTTKETFQAYLRESDRGCVLIASEHLNELLAGLHRDKIETVLGPNKDLVNLILEWPGTLSTFSARIQLAYAYGLVSKDTYQDLQRIKSLRNKAAHPDGSFSFVALIDKLTAIASVKRVHGASLDLTNEAERLQSGATNDHTLKVSFASMAMAVAIEIMETRNKILQKQVINLQKVGAIPPRDSDQ